MMNKKSIYKVKDHLILRDHLAIDRTKLANLRTFLSMVRTALYFAFTGISLYSLEWLAEWRNIAWVFFVISGAILLVGALMYVRVNYRINTSYDPDALKLSEEMGAGV